MKRVIVSLVFLSSVFVWYGLDSRTVNVVEGLVVRSDSYLPIAEARVRIQGRNEFVLTGSDGRFTLVTDLANGTNVTMTAGKQGWFNSAKSMYVGAAIDTIKIDTLPNGDNPNYAFNGPGYCDNCHTLLTDQWHESKHSRAVTNPMFLQIYNGTDVNGTPGVYPGFKLDFPNEGGDCGDCHAPSAALRSPGNTEINDLFLPGHPYPVDTNGVHCDFCHKIDSVEVNYATGVNGSIFMRRPPAGFNRDINFGQFDDVTSFWMGGSYNPHIERSSFCSGCHQYANAHGVIVDDTYDSWAASPYAAQGRQCQDCHMKPNSDSIFASGIGGPHAVKRDTNRIYNQYFRGATSPEMLDAAAAMSVSAHVAGDQLHIETRITNAGAGHKLPTGVSLRNMLLVVSAVDGADSLPQLSGDTIPLFGGVGDPSHGNLAGLPGKAYAMVTKDSVTGQSPAPNWLATEILYDSRIPAHATDTTHVVFDRAGHSMATVRARMLYRAVFKPWADVKGWDMREYVMADTTFIIQLVNVAANDVRPRRLLLHQNRPNPFNGSTAITFELPAASDIGLAVYNVLGQEVANLARGRYPAGRHSAYWDGRNERGESVASGIYLVRLTAAGSTATRKVSFVK